MADDQIAPGRVVDWSTPQIHRQQSGDILGFGVRGPDGGEVHGWEDRLRFDPGDDVSPLIMRSVAAVRDQVIGSAVTTAGQVFIWCHKVIYYTACVRGVDSVWMAPRAPEFWADQTYCRHDGWTDFWLSEAWPRPMLTPQQRLGAVAPGPECRRVIRSDVGVPAPVDSFVCASSGSVWFGSETSVGHMFHYLNLEAIVLLPRSLPCE